MNGKPTYEELEQRIKVLEKEAARRMLAEEALRKERDFISAVLTTAGALVIVLDPQGRIVRFNKACERLTGYAFVEVKDQYFWDLLLIPEEVEPVKAVFAELRSGLFPNEYANYWVMKDGRRRLIMWSNTALLGQEGAVEYIIGTGIDVTERKKIEEALRDSEERYRRLTEAVTDYIYTVRIEERRPVETVHGAACEAVTGYRAEDFKANPHLWIEMIPEDGREPVERQVALILSGVKAEPVEHRIIRKDGAIRWVRNTPVPNLDSEGRLLSYDGLIQDITDRKQAQEALRKAHSELEELNLELENRVRERTEELNQKNKQLVEAERLAAIGKMADRVAHELRNPLTAIGGFARRINERTSADDPNKKYLRMIVEEVIAMESKVSEITREDLAGQTKRS